MNYDEVQIGSKYRMQAVSLYRNCSDIDAIQGQIIIVIGKSYDGSLNIKSTNSSHCCFPSDLQPLNKQPIFID